MRTSLKTHSNTSSDLLLIRFQLQLRPFIELLQPGVLIIDESTGKIIEVNTSALNLLGYSREELTGRFIWEIEPFYIIFPSEATFKDNRLQIYHQHKELSFVTRNSDFRNLDLLIDPFHESNINVLICQLSGRIAEGVQFDETKRRHIDEKEKQIRDEREEIDRLHKQIEDEMAERQRWTQNLHDAINQSLFSAGLIAEVLPRLWERDQTAARRSLEDLRRLTFGAMAEMRVLLTESRPAILSESELADLVMLLGNVVAGRLNIPVSVEAKGKNILPEDVQIALYYLCKEVLTVISRQAKAHKIRIELIDEYSDIDVHIYEDGDTFEIPARGSMQHKDFQLALKRAESCGASLEIKPAKDESTEIVLRWKRRLL